MKKQYIMPSIIEEQFELNAMVCGPGSKDPSSNFDNTEGFFSAPARKLYV